MPGVVDETSLFSITGAAIAQDDSKRETFLRENSES